MNNNDVTVTFAPKAERNMGNYLTGRNNFIVSAHIGGIASRFIPGSATHITPILPATSLHGDITATLMQYFESELSYC